MELLSLDTESSFLRDLVHAMPKATTPSSPGLRQARRHNPLSDDLVASGPLRTKPKKRKATTDGHQADKYVDAKSSRRILEIGQALAEEANGEDPIQAPNTAFQFESRLERDVDVEEEGREQEDDDTWGDENDEIIEEVVRTMRCVFALGQSNNLTRNWIQMISICSTDFYLLKKIL